eukprot:Skav213797  [mRNA]  locus=scaffold1987:238419:245124:+ [translate_table: standard]
MRTKHEHRQELLLLGPILATVHCFHQEELVDAQDRVVRHPSFCVAQIGLHMKIHLWEQRFCCLVPHGHLTLEMLAAFDLQLTGQELEELIHGGLGHRNAALGCFGPIFGGLGLGPHRLIALHQDQATRLHVKA